VFIMLMLHLSY